MWVQEYERRYNADLVIKFMSQVPKNRTDLLPHYSRFIATLNKYMPDIGTEVVSLVNILFSCFLLRIY